MPQKFLLPGIILATMAAVIASQALISGSYTIFSEAMSLNFWPRQLIKYPAKLKGQMYIPFVNSFLFVCCVLVILLFQSSSNMEGAYGLSITITMLMTTILLSVYLKTKHVKMAFIVPMVTIFSIIELSFLVANMFKFLHGGWVTILIASCLVFIMVVWYNARKIKNKYSLFLKIRPYYSIISDLKEDNTVPKYATNLVYLTAIIEPISKVKLFIRSSTNNPSALITIGYFMLTTWTNQIRLNILSKNLFPIHCSGWIYA